MVSESSCVPAWIEFEDLHEVSIGLRTLFHKGDEKLHTKGGGCSLENLYT